MGTGDPKGPPSAGRGGPHPTPRPETAGGDGAGRRRRRRRGRRGTSAGGSTEPAKEARADDGSGPRPHAAREPEPPPRDVADGRRNESRGRRGRRGRRDRERSPASPPPVVPATSRLAAEPAIVQEPLRPDEIAEMKEHLAFLREYKDALRLRLNAAEDLLVNGRREPTDRGVCRHLLGKIDPGIVEAAVGREPLKSNVAARTRMLAGAIRLTADVGVLLAYLETLAPQRSHAEAAAAFAEVARRIDFESLSATRLGRLLQVLIETFQGHERVQVLFSLLDDDAFRRAFDAAASALPADVAIVFAPLRAVHRRLRAEGTAVIDASGLALGLEQVLAAPDPVLRGYAETLRVRMLELALDPGIPPELADRAAGVLLGSLARSGKTFTRLALRRASQLLARHVDDRARATLAEVQRVAPGHRAAEQWLAALAAPRMGRIALVDTSSAAARLVPGFWLDGQRPVWLRTAGAGDDARLASEAALQAALALPAVAPVVEHGVASGIPYVALAAAGRPWHVPDVAAAEGAGENGRRDRPTALGLAAEAARILHALALAAVALPDAAPERFCLGSERTPTLVLVDLDGARATTRDEAAAANGAAAAALARRLVPNAAAPTELRALVQDLDHAHLRARRDD